MAQGKRLLPMKEACQYLGVSRMTLIEAEERGLIAPERTMGGHRRYSLEGLRAFLQQTQSRYEERPPPAQPQGRFQLAQFIADLQGRAHTPDGTLKEALRNLVLLLQLDMGALYLRDEAGVLRLQAVFGIPHWFLAAMATVAADGLSGEVSRGRQPRVYDGHARHDLPPQLEFGQGLCAPLIYQGEALGCVHVIARQQRQFFPGEIDIVATIAVYLASLVVNTQPIERVRAHLRELGLLSQTVQHPTQHDQPANGEEVLLDELATSVAVVSEAGVVTTWNQAIARLSGVPRERALGAAPNTAAPGLASVWAALARTLADGEPRSVYARLPGGATARFGLRRCPAQGDAARVIVEALEVAGDSAHSDALPP